MTDRNELRKRLLDWIEAVHECGPDEQMSDGHLADSLILFVEREIEAATGASEVCLHPDWTKDTLRCVECGEPMTFKSLGVEWGDDK